MPAVIVEFLAGNITFAVFGDPISLILLFGSYGSGAVLARELTVRWQKGFPSTLLLGAVYGMFNEALATGGFFDPHFYSVVGNGLVNYGRWGGVNVIWAMQITIFHAVFSIAVPIIIINALFPAFARRPLVSNRSLLGFFSLLVIVTAVQRVILLSRQPPVNPYAFLIVLAVMGIFILLARFFPAYAAWQTRKAPSNGWLFFSAFVGAIIWLAVIPRLLGYIHVPIVNVLTIICLLLVVSLLLLHLAPLSRRQLVAIAAGVEGILIIHAIVSANFVPPAITLALLIAAWIRSGATAEAPALV
jgi:hypothetical protein